MKNIILSELFSNLDRKLDEKATVKNARSVLKQYKKIKHYASFGGDPSTSNLSVNGDISGAGEHSDRVAKAVIIRDEAAKELEEIERAIKSINEDLQSVVKAKYLKSEFVSDTNLYMDLGMSESSFYRYLKKGELQFAESYNNGGLLAFNE